MNNIHYLHSAKYAFVAAVLMVAFAMLSFFAFEPTLGRADSTPKDFTITQQITNEISWTLTPGNVSMAGSIAGLTGGYATGTTVAVVNTNNALGYNMTIYFATTSSGQAMQASSSAYINNYAPVGGTTTPDYNWIDHTAGQSALFGYTVKGSTTGEVAQAFKDGGAACNTGSNETANKCWSVPTTTPKVIMNSTGPNTSSTSTIQFKVAVPSSPSPALPSAFYTATATLTLTTN